MPTYISHSAQETEQFAASFAKGLQGGEVIAFSGGLGAGKTTFSKGIAKQLGCIDSVSSPTFAIANYYRGPVPFAHFDAYRISSVHDLETAGFFDYLDQGAVIAVEWSENVKKWLPEPIIHIAIETLSEEERQISIEGASWL